MKTQPWFLSFIIISLIPLLNGCWDRLEIEDRSIILGMAIDPVQEGGSDNMSGPIAISEARGYQITVQVAIPGRIPLGPGEGSSSSGPEKSVWILTETGETLDDAMQVLQKDLADRIFLGHLRAIIVNRKLAEGPGIQDLQDYLRRNPEIRRLAWLVISEGEAKAAMDTAPKLERVPTLYLIATMDHAVQLGKLPNVFVGKFWTVESAKGQESVLPLLSVQDHGRIRLEGLALFKGYKMTGTLDPLETMAFMELTNEQKGGYSVAFPLKENSTQKSVIIHYTGRHTRLKLHKLHGQPTFDTYLLIEGNLEEKTSKVSLQNKIPYLEIESNKSLIQKQKKLLSKLQRLQIDSIGFGERVRGEYPDFWKQHVRNREDWDKIFATMPIQCHVKTFIRRAGMSAN